MQNEHIKVSVIVPIYNCEKFIKRCLNSITAQTLKEIEIICINDGSTDDSKKIVEQYAKSDNRIIVINKDNEGQSKARNIGIDIAKGEYIGFVDADDWVDEDFYEKLYNNAILYSADIAAGEIIRLHKLNKKIHLKFTNIQTTENINEKFLLCDIPEKSYVWNKIYKTSELKKHNIKFEEGIIFEDVIFTPLVLYKLNKLVTVPSTAYYYWRRKGSTVTIKSDKANNDSVYAHEKARQFFKEHNIDVSKQEVITKRIKVFGMTIFKTQTKGNQKIFILFNIIKLKLNKKENG